MSTPTRILTALNGELAHTVHAMTTDTLMEKIADIKKLSTALEDHQREDHTIMANLGLSQQGQMEAIKRLAIDKTIPSLKWLKKKIEELDAKARRLKSEFLTIDSGIKDPTERIQTYVYLWGKFDQLDPNARIKRFCLAAEANEVKTMAAMLEHPEYPEGTMITQEVRERALFDRAKRLTPQDHENFEQAELLLEFLTTMRDWIAQWLAEEIGVEPAILRTNLGAEVADVPRLTGAGA
jgi:hypothetical protein